MRMMGAICDFCECIVCHSKRCLESHACSCALKVNDAPAVCYECNRSVWQHGGRTFKCGTCLRLLCEDCEFEHQAMCEVLQRDTYKCMSCRKLGVYTCTRCKVAYCPTHVKSALHKLEKGGVFKCKRCASVLMETKSGSVSVKTHAFGRHRGVASVASAADALGRWGISQEKETLDDEEDSKPKNTFQSFGGVSVLPQTVDAVEEEDESEDSDDTAT
eukprot:Platyproteum_vivax@DN7925_c0_g1_i1.p1